MRLGEEVGALPADKEPLASSSGEVQRLMAGGGARALAAVWP